MKKIIKTSFFEKLIQDNHYDAYLPWEEDGKSSVSLVSLDATDKTNESTTGTNNTAKTPLQTIPGCQVFSVEDYDLVCAFLGDILIGFASAFSYTDESEMCELYVLVDQSVRRHHIGTALVDILMNQITCDTCYLVGSVSSFADYIGATYSHSEHFMKRESTRYCNECAQPDSSSVNAPAIPVPELTDVQSSAASLEYFVEEEDGALYYIACLNGEEVCSLRLDEYEDFVSIAEVFTDVAHRRCGYALSLLEYIFTEYPHKDCMLQVSGNNTSAVKLYLKCGFTFTETTDYYSMS